MRYGLIIIMFILAIAGWIKDRFFTYKEFSFSLFLLIIGLLIIAFVFEIGLNYFDAKDDKHRSDSGKLIFRIKNKIPYPIFLIGGARLIKKRDDIPLLKILEDDLDVKIEKSYLFWKFFPYWQYKLNLTLRNEKNEILVEIKDNIWRINSILIYDKNFTKDAFEVVDRRGEVLLSVRLAKDALDFSGKFYNDKGTGIAIVKDLASRGGGFEIVKNREKLKAKIKPIFKYPSLEYAGILKE